MEMDYSTLHDKSLSLLIYGKGETGEKSYEVFKGRLLWEDGSLYFDPMNGDEPFPIPPDLWPNIQKVKEELSAYLQDAEYMLPFEGDLSEEEEEEESHEDFWPDTSQL